jgi:hypothetical protein
MFTECLPNAQSYFRLLKTYRKTENIINKTCKKTSIISDKCFRGDPAGLFDLEQDRWDGSDNTQRKGGVGEDHSSGPAGCDRVWTLF